MVHLNQSMPARTQGQSKKSAPLDLNAILLECLKEANYRHVEAATLLEDMARENHELLVLLTQDKLRMICYEMIKRVINAHNRQIKIANQNAPAPMPRTASSAGNDRRAAEVMEAARRKSEYNKTRLSDMIFWGNGRLADMTFAEVAVAKNSFRKQKEANALNERFMAKIEPLGKPEQAVGRVCNEARLVALYNEAMKEAA